MVGQKIEEMRGAFGGVGSPERGLVGNESRKLLGWLASLLSSSSPLAARCGVLPLVVAAPLIALMSCSRCAVPFGVAMRLPRFTGIATGGGRDEMPYAAAAFEGRREGRPSPAARARADGAAGSLADAWPFACGAAEDTDSPLWQRLGSGGHMGESFSDLSPRGESGSEVGESGSEGGSAADDDGPMTGVGSHEELIVESEPPVASSELRRVVCVIDLRRGGGRRRARMQ